jgi:hypothetical protein
VWSPHGATYCQNHSFAHPTFLSILTHLHLPQLKLYRFGERLEDRIDFEELALRSIDPSLGPKLSSPDFAGSRHEAKAEDADALQIKVSNIPLDPSFLNFTSSFADPADLSTVHDKIYHPCCRPYKYTSPVSCVP